MKKYGWLLMLMIVASLLTGCATDKATEVVEISERMFITQCNDVYINTDEYMNKTIVLEGMYYEYTDPKTNQVHTYVIRNGPGCCANDGIVGFEILFEGDKPVPNDWIRVTGKVEKLDNNELETIVLRLDQIEIKAERGQETVLN
ncbi:hypothetical protein [Acetobacterium sp. UBA5834]|uniref:TIGR03943 family putative permease subunit n=1 Tax=Acetobacterium sp. UBA5834 TaxID=1945907 RepID=UPI00257BCC1F|nr:hypothetical protein [Acetobacterium sp. UBA5834]